MEITSELLHRMCVFETPKNQSTIQRVFPVWEVDHADNCEHADLRPLSASRRYMDELMRLKAAAAEQGCDYLTWNDIQACIDQVNVAVQEEHDRKEAPPLCPLNGLVIYVG